MNFPVRFLNLSITFYNSGFFIFVNKFLKGKIFEMNNLTTSSLSKFSGLMFFLKRSKNDFEMLADEIENYTLKSALNGLSEESNFYASEIKNYLKHLGINASSLTATEFSSNYFSGDFGDSYLGDCEKGMELQTLCTYNEKSLTKAYNDLLDETLPCKSLQEIIVYQLNALKISFLKIKTLNTARFAMY